MKNLMVCLCKACERVNEWITSRYQSIFPGVFFFQDESTRGWVITAIAKLSAHLGSLTEEVEHIIDRYGVAISGELRQVYVDMFLKFVMIDFCCCCVFQYEISEWRFTFFLSFRDVMKSKYYLLICHLWVKSSREIWRYIRHWTKLTYFVIPVVNMMFIFKPCPSLSFLDNYVANSLSAGARPYQSNFTQQKEISVGKKGVKNLKLNTVEKLWFNIDMFCISIVCRNGKNTLSAVSFILHWYWRWWANRKHRIDSC